MTIDLTGGMLPSDDDVTETLPDVPNYREGTSMWIWDDEGRVSLPRIGIEAFGAVWDATRLVSVNATADEGRVFVVRDQGPPLPTRDDDGRPRVLGGGGLEFRCLEPFRHWQTTFDGQALATTSQDQVAVCRSQRDVEQSSVPVRFRIDARMAAPPWAQGTLDPDGRFIVGEERFEQLFVAEGSVELDGAETTFRGGGLRIHRKGGSRSDYSDWYGHNWQSALFPSGRAFGFIHYTPRPDGSVKYHEGWVLDGDEVLPAKVVDTPWKRGWDIAGEDVSVTLRTRRGDVAITGTTHASTFSPAMPVADGVFFPPVQQGTALYAWEGEQAFGMIERSTRADLPSAGR
jgi:hypothetical protein